MNRKLIKLETKEALKGNRFMLFVAIFVYNALVGSLTYVFGIGLLISPMLFAGLFMVSKLVLTERRLNFDLLFTFLKDLNHGFKILGLNILRGLIVFAGTLLFIIPGIIFSFQYSQALNIMAENKEMGIWDAMKRSKEMMIGHKWELFVFYLSFIGHVLLIAITFGLYGIYAYPYLYAAQFNYYLHLSGQKDSKPFELEFEELQ